MIGDLSEGIAETDGSDEEMSEAEEEAEEENSEEVCEFHLENARVIVDNTQNFVVNTHVILLFMQNSNTTKNKWLFATIWKKLDSGSPLSSRFNCGDWPVKIYTFA